METYGRWQTGQQILQQDLWRGKLLSSRPVTVVEDTPTRLALYTHPGSPYYSATAISRNRKALSLSERVGILMSDDIPPLERRVVGRSPCADSHSTWSSAFSVALLDPGVAFSVWYVNLQEPVRRTPRGILVQDQVLDIVASLDRAWNWKDEDDFLALKERGFFTGEEAASIRAEGERMIAAIERNAPPFCEGWETWRPDASWPIPQIPEDWSVIS